MKLRKGLFMLCAGLSLCACSSDDGNQFPEGTGIVEVRIVPPTSGRAITTPSGDGNTTEIKVQGTYQITLDAAKGGGTKEVAWNADGLTATFTNVSYPKSVTVTLNDHAKNEYTLNDLTTIKEIDPINIPAYGYTESFTPSTVDNLTTYTTSVKMAIPVARLEIGNITFNNTNSIFSKLTAAGVYMDNLRESGGTYDAETGVFTNPQYMTFGNYQFGETDDKYGVGEPYILGNADETDLLTAAMPGNSDVYAFNFYGATQNGSEVATTNPHFKIFFSATKNSDDAQDIPRYAMITTFKNNSNQEITLENGKIYRVTAAQLEDKNIVVDESNAMEYQVSVTVEEAKWSVADITGIWED